MQTSEANYFFTKTNFNSKGLIFKKTMKKIFEVSQKAWNSFFKPTINFLAPVIGMAVGAKLGNPQVARVTTNLLKSIGGAKNLSLTYLHGDGLRIKVFRIISSKVCQINE